jgi:hypothetical protein
MSAEWIVLPVAFGASALTFFSGFGLGTLLLPAFALFYPIELAVASTAVVHFINSLVKLALVGRQANIGIVLRFGLPAIAAALVGAWLLTGLANVEPIASYTVGGLHATVLPAKLIVGGLLFIITLLELSPRFQRVSVPPRYIPVGGALSGFFGGLSGMQGALRSAFLIRAGLSKEAFIGTGVVVATFIDLTRLGVYAGSMQAQRAQLDLMLLGGAVLAATLGAVAGNRYLKKVTLQTVQRIVGIMLAIVAVGLMAGVL